LLEASEAYGKPLGVADQIGELMAIAGFVEVVERRFKWPIGGWEQGNKLKQLGKLNRKHWKQGMEGWCIALLTRALKVRVFRNPIPLPVWPDPYIVASGRSRK
jgi:hypothetical protein